MRHWDLVGDRSAPGTMHRALSEARVPAGSRRDYTHAKSITPPTSIAPSTIVWSAPKRSSCASLSEVASPKRRPTSRPPSPSAVSPRAGSRGHAHGLRLRNHDTEARALRSVRKRFAGWVLSFVLAAVVAVPLFYLTEQSAFLIVAGPSFAGLNAVMFLDYRRRFGSRADGDRSLAGSGVAALRIRNKAETGHSRAQRIGRRHLDRDRRHPIPFF